MDDDSTQLSPRFEAVLNWLDANRARAAEARVLLHKRLTEYFDRNHCTESEDLADQTFDRVGKLLLEGKDVPNQNQEAYLSRVAFYVLQEDRRRHRRVRQFEEHDPEPVDPGPLPNITDERMKKERLQVALDECLENLPPESRIMLLEYYAEDKALKIDTRNRMAQRLGIRSAVLRNRIWKLRNILRECIVERLTDVEFAASSGGSK